MATKTDGIIFGWCMRPLVANGLVRIMTADTGQFGITTATHRIRIFGGIPCRCAVGELRSVTRMTTAAGPIHIVMGTARIMRRGV